jgi:S-formylglutathione hydrolase FrmB
MKKQIVKITIFVVLVLIFATVPDSLFAQAKDLPQNSGIWKEEKLASKLMQREMPYRVVVPQNYASEGKKRFPVLYLLHGLGGNYKNWTDQTKLSEYSKLYEIILVTPEGENGWYTDSATNEKNKYESYII